MQAEMTEKELEKRRREICAEIMRTADRFNTCKCRNGRLPEGNTVSLLAGLSKLLKERRRIQELLSENKCEKR
ncbi:hypothetical protein Osc1_02750 [Hominimerdicola sp. 21CYCFAH17_S]